MNKDILLLVQSLSNEKDVSEAFIFEAVELALASVTEKRYEEPVTIRVSIDQKTGEYESFRAWEVVANDAEELIPGQHMTLEHALALDESLAIGDVVEEKIENVVFGRISAQQAKHVLMQKVREAERAKILKKYENRIGDLLIGSVKRVTRDNVILDMGAHAEALLPRDQMIPREAFRLNDRVRVSLQSLSDEPRGPQLLVSRTCPEFLVSLFKIEVPEVGEEVIQILAVARDPGSRAKIAVKTNDGRIDPVGACVGMRGVRVQAVKDELGGERIDIITWDDSPAQLVINAMQPAEVASIVVDEDTHSMDVAVAESNLSQAIGKLGQNIRLASELTGWKLNVMSEEEVAKKHADETVTITSLFIEQLDVDEGLAELLVHEGFKTLADIAYVAEDEMLEIEGLDADMVEILKGRASDALFMQEIENQAELAAVELDEDLLAVEGMTDEMARQLTLAEIATRDALAECAVDELLDVVDLTPEAAGELIMKARAHWFETDEETTQ